MQNKPTLIFAIRYPVDLPGGNAFTLLKHAKVHSQAHNPAYVSVPSVSSQTGILLIVYLRSRYYVYAHTYVAYT